MALTQINNTVADTATLTANNASFLGGVAAADYALTANLPTGGFSNMEVFTSNGTFTVPTGITKVKVTVVGGGGGGFTQDQGESPQIAEGGGAGGCAIEIISGLTSGGTVAVTVGLGGAGRSNGQFGTPVAGSTGGTSSFGLFCSATGGVGGGAGGTGGLGSGGQINARGGNGGYSGNPIGGNSIFGGGGSATSNNATLGGGGSGYPYAGAAGIVVVEY